MIVFLSFISTSHDLFNLEGVSEAVDVNVDMKVDNLITNETSNPGVPQPTIVFAEKTRRDTKIREINYLSDNIAQTLAMGMH
jgi:hypothetical protein